jgi:hypothetical protein
VTRRAVERLGAALIALACVTAPSVSAQAPADRSLFQTAQALERAARAGLAEPDAQDAPTLAAVRRAVAAYQDVATRHPKSAVVDAALWLGAQVSMDGYLRFGQAADRDTAVRMLTRLIRRYPSGAMAPLARLALPRARRAEWRTPVTLGRVLLREMPGRVLVDIDMDAPARFTSEHLANPPRFYVDVPFTRVTPALRNTTLVFPDAAVRQIRVGARPDGATRVVLDLAGVERCSAAPETEPTRIVVTCLLPARPDLEEPADLPPLVSHPIARVERPPAGATPRTRPEAVELLSSRPVAAVAPIAVTSVPSFDMAAAAPPAALPEPEPPAQAPAPVTPPSAGLPPAGVPAAPAPEPATEPVVPPVAPPTPTTVPAPAVAATPPPTAVPTESDAPAPLWSRTLDAVSGPAWLAGPVVSTSVTPRPADVPAHLPYSVSLPSVLFAVQPTVQVTAATQVTTGDASRLGQQRHVEPDLGVQWIAPGMRFGNAYADFNLTNRDGRAILGRAMFHLDGVKAAGLTWNVDAGDTWSSAVLPDFGHSNLLAPPVTFVGASISGRSNRSFLVVNGGRVTAQRNLFGTDTVPLGQDLAQALWAWRPSERLDLLARGSWVRSRAVDGYTALADRSIDGGASVRVRPAPGLELVADGSVSQFRRKGAPKDEVAPSGLAGVLWAGSHGWLQLNAQRFSLGRYPVVNFPYSDRAGVYGSGQWDLGSRVRLFGGVEQVDTNLNREASEQATTGLAPGTYSRGYAGLGVGISGSSMFTARVEQGGRRSEPSKFGSGFQSDTGVLTSEWHSRFQAGNLFVRYERRDNVDPGSGSSDFTQHDAMGQVYVNVAGQHQLFGQVLFSRRADGSGDGQTLWLAGGGTQVGLGRLFLRLEATASRTFDWTTHLTTPRQTLAAGLSGQIAPRTSVSIDMFVDRSIAAASQASPWMTRTMIRVTRAFPYGAGRTARAGTVGLRPGAAEADYDGPVGRVNGIVFADWDANGVMDAGEDPLPGISLAIGRTLTATSGADGRFTFFRAPVGEQLVRVDLASLPADYDPPAEPARPVAVERSRPASVDFGLFPLGAIRGTVYQDTDGNGTVGPGDPLVDAAVIVLDDGARTEATREGRFSFDPVRMGPHTVTLLVASLPDGAEIVGGTPTLTAELGRNAATATLTFLVKVEKRKEIRKVFAPKK